METIGQDIRFAFRSLRKSPGFAVVAIVTLALAIGVNTSIFSLASSIMFADLPMRDSDTVAMIRGVNAELGIEQGSLSAADYLDLQERARSFESLSALRFGEWVLTGAEQPTRLQGIRATANTTSSWRLPPALGRGFSEDEDEPGAEPVAMLSHGFWQDGHDGRQDILGESVMLDGIAHTIVGVMHPKFEFATFRTAQVIVPLIFDRGEPDRIDRELFVSGRLLPGVTQAMATEEVRAIGGQLAEDHPGQNRGWGLSSTPVMASLINDNTKRMLLLLQFTVGMVILIACANVANMLLARATSRAREMAVRTALGAGRRRLVRQLMTESLLISFAAGALGLGVAGLLNEALVWISAGTEQAFLMNEINGPVLAFTLFVSLVAPLAFGLLPALRAPGTGGSAALRARGSSGDRSSKRARNVLVTAQILLALSLMIVATLLTRTVSYGSTRPLNFDAANLVTIGLDLPAHTYVGDEAVLDFYTRVREQVAAVPGFGAVELTDALPAVGFGTRRPLEVEGVEQPVDRAAPTAHFTIVSSGYLEMAGLPLQAGRTFADSDDAASVPVAVVSRAAAERFWPDEMPVGRRLRVAGTAEWYQVIGVVSDVQEPVGSEPLPRAIYVAHAQQPERAMYLATRSDADAATIAFPIRAAIWSLDADMPIGSIRTLDRARYENMAVNYALISLFGTFAVFALIMAAVGIYGVMAYTVSQRRNEIGVRMALGAEAGRVRWMILGQGAKLLSAGLAIGLLLSLGMSQMLKSMIVGISPTDPLTFVGVPLVLVAVGLVANLVPARRATRLDPAITLRSD